MLAKKIAVGFGIAIILPLMFHYGVSTFSPSPKYSDYRIDNYPQDYKNASPEKKKEVTAKNKNLNLQFKSAKKEFQQHLFFVAVPLGLLLIIIGVFISNNAIGAGLVFGGIFSVSNGYINYWSELPDSLRFASLIVAFLILITVGYKKLEGEKQT